MPQPQSWEHQKPVEPTENKGNWKKDGYTHWWQQAKGSGAQTTFKEKNSISAAAVRASPRIRHIFATQKRCWHQVPSPVKTPLASTLKARAANSHHMDPPDVMFLHCPRPWRLRFLLGSTMHLALAATENGVVQKRNQNPNARIMIIFIMYDSTSSRQWY